MVSAVTSVPSASDGGFAGGAAIVADEEQRRARLAVGAAVAGDIGVLRFDAVGEVVLDQEIERAVDRDRREPLAVGLGEPVDDVIGGGRHVALEQRLQHLPALRR